MYILGIETSCDESAASVVKYGQKKDKISVLSNIVTSQIEIHQKYGGVVPEVAAREHVLNILPVINEALEQASIKPNDITALAVTSGPGLITSLISGVETARTLAFAWNKPLIGINHIEGHIYANFINPTAPLKFPALILTVSGGHTNLVLMSKTRKIKIIGETRDDAAGEAYDKAAKMMGLGYPGGPIISQQAALFNPKATNLLSAIKLPRPMLNSPDLDFSFSGLKTALLYQLQKDKAWRKRIPEYCHEYQQAIIEILIHKTLKAAKKVSARSVMLSGGVSANTELRTQLRQAVQSELEDVSFLVPEKEYTTDNAAMIASAAVFKISTAKQTGYAKLRVDPSLQLK